MAFQFSLATVLRVRESIEEREERALERIQLQMAHVARQIDQLDEALQKAHAAREEALTQTMPAGDLQSMLRQAQIAVETKHSLESKLQTMEDVRIEQMKVYQTAHRNREAMTNMQNEQRDAYDLLQTRDEQKFLDDIFMARRHRK